MSEPSQSFFFRNFPEDCDMDFIRKKFSEIGNVIDLFKPQKNDKSGKPFGFVRFGTGIDKEIILSGLNNTWIGSYKIRAYVPKYDGNLQEKKIVNPLIPKNRTQVTKRCFDAQCGRDIPNVSYADIAEGRKKKTDEIHETHEPPGDSRDNDYHISSENKNHTVLHFQSRNEEKQWLENCIIGVLKKGITWENYKEEMQEECGKL